MSLMDLYLMRCRIKYEVYTFNCGVSMGFDTLNCKILVFNCGVSMGLNTLNCKILMGFGALVLVRSILIRRRHYKRSRSSMLASPWLCSSASRFKLLPPANGARQLGNSAE